MSLPLIITPEAEADLAEAKPGTTNKGLAWATRSSWPWSGP
jgi:hypothetical protein